MEKKHIINLTFKAYPTQVKLSNAQNPKYFEWNGHNIASKGKLVFKKCLNKDTIGSNWVNKSVHWKYLKPEYCIIGFKGDKIYSRLMMVDGKEVEEKEVLSNFTATQLKKPTKYFLCKIEEDGMLTYSLTYTKVLSNPTQVNQPKYISISGQNFFAKQNEFISSKMVNTIKSFYYKSLMTKDLTNLDKLRSFLINNTSPLIIELEVIDTIKHHLDKSNNLIGRVWDVDNRAYPYNKTFLDFLVKGYYKDNVQLMKPFLIDDDRLRVRGGGYYFTPCDVYEERKLVFHFYTTEKYSIHQKIIKFLNNAKTNFVR